MQILQEGRGLLWQGARFPFLAPHLIKTPAPDDTLMRWLLLVLCLPCIFGLEFESVGSHWLNKGQSASLEDISFSAFPTAGDPAERVVLRIGESDRVIIKFSECQEYKQRYKFCFTNTQFNPESDQGTVDYEKDVYYSQVRIETYYIPDEALGGIDVSRTFSNTKPLVGEVIEVTVTISNNNEETGLYGLSYTELVPTTADVILLKEGWNEQTLTWSGNILAGESTTLSYTLKPLVGENISITGKLRSEETSIDEISVLSPKASGFLSVNATGGQASAVGAIHDFSLELINLVDSDVEILLLLDVPKGLLYTGGSLQYEKLIGESMRYSIKRLLKEDEEFTFDGKIRIDEQGEFYVGYTIVAKAGSQEEEYKGTFHFSIPFQPLTLGLEVSSEYFTPDKPIPLSIVLRNKDKTAKFTDVSVQVKTPATVVGLERAKLDGIAPESEVVIVDANLTFARQEPFSYALNVSYSKGSQRLSVAKEIHFFPDVKEGTPQEDESLTTLQETASSQEGAPGVEESTQEQRSSQDATVLEETIGTIKERFSYSTIFLIFLVVIALGVGVGMLFFKHSPKEPTE
jgi:hypothetical protein